MERERRAGEGGEKKRGRWEERENRQQYKEESRSKIENDRVEGSGVQGEGGERTGRENKGNQTQRKGKGIAPTGKTVK